ncbi:MAG: hypothetical protein RI907_2695 [Pseudomonadota bacterium]
MPEHCRIDDADLLAQLEAFSPESLDALPFGVIGFDADGRICRYNRYESEAAHFPVNQVLGQHVFEELAPCFNNYLVAGVLEAAAEASLPVDTTLPYVLTFRMKPTRVKLRLLAPVGPGLRYILVQRQLPA